MWKDPIVQNVRKAGEELAKKANYDLHVFFQNLRNNEKKQKYTGFGYPFCAGIK